MPTDADHVIAELHAGADELHTVVRGLTPDQLTGPSGAAEWDVSQVLGHLGSGALITRATLDAALAGEPNPGQEAARAIWARWDAMSARERADAYLTADMDLLARLDSLDAATRETLRIDLGFLPDPVDVATASRLRLNEAALHSWDVRVALDPDSTVRPGAVALLLDRSPIPLSWIAKPAALDGRSAALTILLHDPDRTLGLTVDETGCTPGAAPSEPDATLTAPAEAWLRLVSGRLAPEHTPSTVRMSGDITLDDLRKVFPGY